MMYLIKTELYKFKKDISVWIISFILICCASISIFTEVYSSAENAVLNLGKDSVSLILACAIYVGFSCTDDFTNRTVIYAITYGNRRLQILLAKYFRYIFGCTIIIISYMSVSFIISFLALGTEITLPCLFMYAVNFWFFAMLNISFALSFYSIGCSTFSVHTYILTPNYNL